jgi:hypothetical protein
MIASGLKLAELGNHARAITAAIILLCASSVNAQPNRELYELQVRCGKQAADAFARDHVPVQNTKDGQRIMNYENHFSAQLNKCFFLEILVVVEKGKWSKQLRLFDLNENKEYGSYFDSDQTPRYVSCYVRDTKCSSEEEWRRLAKPYLED